MKNHFKKSGTLVNHFPKAPSNLKWITDINNTLVYANNSFLRYFGMNKKVLNKSISDVFPKSIAGFLSETQHKIRNGKDSGNGSAIFLWPGESPGTLMVNSFAINGTDKPALVGFEAMLISEATQKQEDLKKETERSIYLDRATSEAIWEWDVANGEVFSNKEFEELTGIAQLQTSDLSWWFNLVHVNDRERVQLCVSAVLKSKETSWMEEYQIQNAEGKYINVRDRGFILYENDQPIRMIVSLQDLSEISELRDRLIREKIGHLQEKAELIINAQEKERLLLGNELHDNVNQILATARLYLDMIKPAGIQEEEIKEKTKEFILMAYEEIRKLSKELVSPQLRANSITKGIQELVNDINASGKFEIEFEYDPSIWVSKSLKITLFRIAQEQLKNIIQYSNAQKIKLELRSANHEIKMCIADNGDGFDKHHVKKGLGLSNILERVKLFDGQVDLDTAPGKGCRLTVTIPA